METVKRIKENQIHSSDELLEYLKEKATRHPYHKYYAKRRFIEEILTNHCVFLSDGRNWNDTTDRDLLNPNGASCRQFGLCLSFSRSESVAMWMLYSGNDGCMIDYDKKVIEEVLKTDEVALGFFDNGIFHSERLLKKEDFQITYADVVYYGESTAEGKQKDWYYVKRSDEINKAFCKDPINGLGCYKKATSWSYENECRIVIKVPGKHIADDVTHAKIEFDVSHIKDLIGRVYDSPNVKEPSYIQSALFHKINWDLCRGCEEKCLETDCQNRTRMFKE